MRYELADREWAAGVPRVNDRRVLNGIFWVLRSGAPWRDLPDNFGPYTTCYNRFVRWRRAGVWAPLVLFFGAVAARPCARGSTSHAGIAGFSSFPKTTSAAISGPISGWIVGEHRSSKT
jgi:Putative transposase of IS4/5 family (DUF4096)